MIAFSPGCEIFKRKNDIVIGDDEPLSIVNSKKIFLSEFQNNVRKLLDSNPEIRPIYETEPKRVKEIVINKMVEKELLLQEAVRRRVVIAKEELEAFASNAMTPYVGANTEMWLRKVNVGKEEWKKDYSEFLIVQRLIDQEVNRRIEVSEAELKEYYAEHSEEFRTPLQHEVQHILLETNETAQLVLKQLKKGANFETLVNNHSIAADKTNGGYMGYVSKGVLPAEFDKAIFSLKKVGRISPIVSSQHGFHIFKLIGTVKPKKPRLKDVRKKVEERIRENKFNEAYSVWYAKLRERANIFIDDNLLLKDEGF